MADHIVRPIIRSIVRPIIRALTAPAGTGGASFTPESLFPTYSGAWFTAYDNSFMTVNSDGTGGAPATGAAARRLTDRSGGGFHLLRAAGVAPTGGGDGLIFPEVPGVGSSFMNSTPNAFAGNTQNFTLMWYGDVYALPELTTYASLDNLSGNNFEMTGAYSSTVDGTFQIITNGAFVDTGLKVQSARTVICCRGSASGFELWVNGQQFSRAALTSVTLKDLNVMGGAFTKMRMYEWLVVKGVLTDTEFTNLRAYGATKAGYAANSTDVLLARGDSLTAGVGSALCKPWTARRTEMPNALVYNYGKSGEAAFSPSTGTAANLNTAYKGAARNVCVFWMGTNDIVTFARTAAQTETAIRNYCATMYAAGWTVVVCTLQDMVGFSATATATNALINANALTVPYAHAIADLGGDSRLQNSADTTYFNADGVHLTDAGHAVVASIIDAAIAST